MRVSRRNWVLLAMLAVLLVLDFTDRETRDEVRDRGPLFPDLSPTDVRAVELSDLDLENEPSMRFARMDEDSPWVLSDHHGYPDNGYSARGLLNWISGLSKLDLLAEDRASHAEFGVDEGLRIVLKDADGQVLADLIQGEQASGGRACFVRAGGQDAVYRAPGLGRRLTTDLVDWIDTGWLVFETGAVTSFRLAGSDLSEPLEFVRDERVKSRWTLDGKRQRTSVVGGLLSTLAALRLESVQGRTEAGERPPEARLELTLSLEDGRQIRAFVTGGQDDDPFLGQRLEDTWLVGLPRPTYELLLGKARALFD